MGIPNYLRIKKGSDYSMVFRQRNQSAGTYVVLSCLQKEKEEFPRFGFITSKKLGNAVVRNKIRRRLRMIAQVYLKMRGYDIVAIARRSSVKASFTQLYQDWERQLDCLGLTYKNDG